MEFQYTKPIESSIKRKCEQGFTLIILLPIMSILITGLLGVFTMSIGIKNITETKQICMKKNLEIQQELKSVLIKLFRLNESLKKIYEAKKILNKSLKAAILSGNLPAIKMIKISLKTLDLQAFNMSLKQKSLLSQSQIIKEKGMRNFKTSMQKSYIKDIQLVQKSPLALAVKKTSLDNKISIYEPVPFFSEMQKIELSWQMQAIAKSQFTKYKCTATIEKDLQTWRERLFH